MRDARSALVENRFATFRNACLDDWRQGEEVLKL
jgi:hypothetical protein